MSKPKFTPLPWKVKFSMCEDLTFASIEKENHKTIAEVFLNDNEDEQEANAYLFKAAPNMYKELEMLSALFRKNAIYLSEREKIENILREARGEGEVEK